MYTGVSSLVAAAAAAQRPLASETRQVVRVAAVPARHGGQEGWAGEGQGHGGHGHVVPVFRVRLFALGLLASRGRVLAEAALKAG